MPIKNYSTTVSAVRTVGQIQEMLAKHGALRVMMEYGPGGRVGGVVFAIDTAQGSASFRLPARVEQVKTVMKKQGVKCDDAKAENVAWRNVKDWIEAQLAMVETGQAEMAEVFMPYMLDSQGKTLYMAYGAKLLEAAEE